jgi:hypothetical protein
MLSYNGTQLFTCPTTIPSAIVLVFLHGFSPGFKKGQCERETFLLRTDVKI